MVLFDILCLAQKNTGFPFWMNMFDGCKISDNGKTNNSPETLDDKDMTVFTLTSTIVVSVTCAFLIVLLACGARAVIFSTKLPRPFRKLCKVILVTDVILVVTTGIQPWIDSGIKFDKEYVGTCCIMVSIATTLVSLERVFALKCPLKYIRCTGDDKFTSHLVASVFTSIMLTYLFVRLLVCYMLRYTLEIQECMPYHVYSILSIQGLLASTATICFALVCHTAATNKRQHTRRVTRMGLPQNHALNATDTRVSAMLFILYPLLICLSVFSVVLVYWPIIPDEAISAWLSIATRIVHCAVHGVLFNAWFDEWRLHFLTLLSPLSENLRDWADVMRINVYNIVVAEAFDESRLQIEGSIKTRKISRSRLSRTSKMSAVSASGSLSITSASPKSLPAYIQEQTALAKKSRLESIEETDV